MRFLILGAGGMAGHTISIYLEEKGHEVTGFARRKLDFVDTVTGDAANMEFVRGVIVQGKYDAVVNAIGILNDNAENNKLSAVFLNGCYPHFLADITKDTDTQIIHISTDCVFSGKSGSYTESSLRDGTTFYDRTKALGELEDTKNLTLRNSIVGPDINTDGIGLLNWFMKQSGTVNGYTEVLWTGITTLQLAKIIEKAAVHHASGLYNMVPDRSISKYELLKLFNKHLRKNEVDIRPYSGVASNKTLVRTRYEFEEKVPDYEVMVREMSEWMSEHKYLYPHYDL